MDCLFCKIIAGEIPSKAVYEDDQVFAFHDVSPEAPVHILVVPKKHITDFNDLTTGDAPILDAIRHAIQTIASEMGIKEKGYRIVNNCGEEGGQTVGHIHFHLLGGRKMHWPAG